MIHVVHIISSTLVREVSIKGSRCPVRASQPRMAAADGQVRVTAQRPRSCIAAAGLAEVLQPFVKSAQFLKYEESMKGHVRVALLVPHAPMLRALLDVDAGVISQATAAAAFLHIVEKTEGHFSLTESQIADWTATMSRRLRCMLRHVLQAQRAKVPAKWLQAAGLKRRPPGQSRLVLVPAADMNASQGKEVQDDDDKALQLQQDRDAAGGDDEQDLLFVAEVEQEGRDTAKLTDADEAGKQESTNLDEGGQAPGRAAPRFEDKVPAMGKVTARSQDKVEAPTQEKLQLKKRGRVVLRATEAGPFAYGYDTELGVAWRMAPGGVKQLTNCFQASGGMDEAIVAVWEDGDEHVVHEVSVAEYKTRLQCSKRRSPAVWEGVLPTGATVAVVHRQDRSKLIVMLENGKQVLQVSEKQLQGHPAQGEKLMRTIAAEYVSGAVDRIGLKPRRSELLAELIGRTDVGVRKRPAAASSVRGAVDLAVQPLAPPTVAEVEQEEWEAEGQGNQEGQGGVKSAKTSARKKPKLRASTMHVACAQEAHDRAFNAVPPSLFSAVCL